MPQTLCTRSVVSWALTLAVAGVGGAVVAVTASAGNPQAAVAEARGAQIYAANCAACHGPLGQGGEGEGVQAGPPLVGIEAAYADLLMRTGRMPIRADRLGVNRDRLTDSEREAALAWMSESIGLEGELPTVARGDRTRGHELYALHCSACHGATGQGGIGAEGTVIRSVAGLDPIAIAEAVRVGPFDMPRFDADVLSDSDVDALAAFAVEDLTRPPKTPLGIAEMHRVAFLGMAAAVAVALLAVVVAVAKDPAAPSRLVEEEEGG